MMLWVQEFGKSFGEKGFNRGMQKMQQLFLHRIALQVCSHMAGTAFLRDGVSYLEKGEIDPNAESNL